MDKQCTLDFLNAVRSGHSKNRTLKRWYLMLSLLALIDISCWYHMCIYIYQQAIQRPGLPASRMGRSWEAAHGSTWVFSVAAHGSLRPLSTLNDALDCALLSLETDSRLQQSLGGWGHWTFARWPGRVNRRDVSPSARDQAASVRLSSVNHSKSLP